MSSNFSGNNDLMTPEQQQICAGYDSAGTTSLELGVAVISIQIIYCLSLFCYQCCLGFTTSALNKDLNKDQIMWLTVQVQIQSCWWKSALIVAAFTLIFSIAGLSNFPWTYPGYGVCPFPFGLRVCVWGVVISCLKPLIALAHYRRMLWYQQLLDVNYSGTSNAHIVYTQMEQEPCGMA